MRYGNERRVSFEADIETVREALDYYFDGDHGCMNLEGHKALDRLVAEHAEDYHCVVVEPDPDALVGVVESGLLVSKLEQFATKMNLFPEVTWDRCTVRPRAFWTFGWIDRDDGHHDYMEFVAESDEGEEGIRCGCSTSSAHYSAEFSRRLHGEDAEHYDCERVEDIFGDLVARKIELKAKR